MVVIGIFIRITSEGTDPPILLTDKAIRLNHQPQRLTPAEGILLPLESGKWWRLRQPGVGRWEEESNGPDGKRPSVGQHHCSLLFSPAADWLGTSLSPWSPSKFSISHLENLH